jgi:hypothetical protein
MEVWESIMVLYYGGVHLTTLGLEVENGIVIFTTIVGD